MSEVERRISVPEKQPQFDIVILGATGYTGTLVAEWFALHIQSSCRWAIAGRNQEKLNFLREKLCRIGKLGQSEVPIVLSDVNDESSLDRMASNAHVIIDCVGPYIWWGEPVVKACLKNKAHYLDVNGEPAYLSMLIQNYHQLAEEANVLIIPCCGFDSVPAEVGAYQAAKLLRDSTNITIRQFIESDKIEVSAGTTKTILHSILPNTSLIQTMLMSHPTYCSELKKWALPLATSDTFIISRSATLEPQLYPKQIIATSHLSSTFIRVFLLMVLLWIALLLFRIPFVRYLSTKVISMSENRLNRRLPTINARVSLITFAETHHPKRMCKITVSGRDPYEQTAQIVSLCALLLVKQNNKLKKKGGVVTPVTTFGDLLIQKMKEVGFTISEETFS